MADTTKVSVPIPPADAQKFHTGCKYCIVGCGYNVYKWPLGKDGGRAPSRNALGADLTKPNTQSWISPSMHGVVKDADGRSFNVAIVPDNDCVVNSGLHSVRGGTMGLSVYREDAPTRDRLKHPTIVQHGSQEASWDDAVALVGGVTKALLDKHGPDSIGVKFADHGGQGGGYEFTWATGKFFYASVRTTMATVHNRPTVFGEPMASRDMGIPELNIAYEDAEIADTIVIFGANPYADQTNYFFNHMIPNLQGSTADKKRKAYPGKTPLAQGRMIVVDPRRTITVAAARTAAGNENVLFLQVTPGTDVTLWNAVSRVVLEHHWDDPAFVRDHVEDSSVGPYHESVGMGRSLGSVLADAERVTGVPRADIVRAAEWIAKPMSGGHKPATLFHYEKGAIWSIQNYDVIASYVNLAVLTGNLGKPGTGCARLGGHQEGYVRPDYPGKRPGVYVEKLLAEGKGPMLWWVLACNPIQTAPAARTVLDVIQQRGKKVSDALDQGGSIDDRVKRVVAAVEDGGLFVVAEDIYPTQVVEHAHVVFPAATQFELNMTSINGERRMRLYQKFMDPPGTAKPDWQIMALVANHIRDAYVREGNQAMADRFAGYDWKTDADVFLDASRVSAQARSTNPATEQAKAPNAITTTGPAGGAPPVSSLPAASKPTFDPEDISFLDHEYLRGLGNNGIQVPVNVSNGKRSGTVRFFTDGKFNRPNGKAMFIPANQPELPAEIAAQKRKYKYLINNGRFNMMWQTGYESWRKPIVEDRWGDREDTFLELNPSDAKALGVQSGDVLRVHNDYASTQAIAYVTDAVKPGQPFMLFAQPKKGTAGFLVTPHVDPKTNIPSYKLTYANIERIAGKPSSFAHVTFKDLESLG
jgi:arsenite oxidase large subunit